MSGTGMWPPFARPSMHCHRIFVNNCGEKDSSPRIGSRHFRIDVGMTTAPSWLIALDGLQSPMRSSSFVVRTGEGYAHRGAMREHTAVRARRAAIYPYAACDRDVARFHPREASASRLRFGDVGSPSPRNKPRQAAIRDSVRLSASACRASPSNGVVTSPSMR